MQTSHRLHSLIQDCILYTVSGMVFGILVTLLFASVASHNTLAELWEIAKLYTVPIFGTMIIARNLTYLFVFITKLDIKVKRKWLSPIIQVVVFLGLTALGVIIFNILGFH